MLMKKWRKLRKGTEGYVKEVQPEEETSSRL
jgi:hypothetical protein